VESLFTALVDLVSTLRGEQGCPWDKKQTTKAFRTFLVEEVYELIDAIEKDDFEQVRGELGDLLFHIVFIARICEENQLFTIWEVLSRITDKMKGRHPHVFGPGDRDPLSVERQWEDLKKEEGQGYEPISGIPSILPALSRAYLISRRASKIGFDWERVEDVYHKMAEEMTELQEAVTTGSEAHIEEELGDLLFTIVNVARFHKVDPEAALRGSIEKFIRRFSYVEQRTNVKASSLETMDALWNEAKDMEKKGP
jgi:tetrapyrrole methylase family protein / MazG family protein